VFISRVFRISVCANGVLVSHSLEGIGVLSERTMNGIWNRTITRVDIFKGTPIGQGCKPPSPSCASTDGRRKNLVRSAR
jgi:hypothetical protein